jgi:hypothetical protein
MLFKRSGMQLAPCILSLSLTFSFFSHSTRTQFCPICTSTPLRLCFIIYQPLFSRLSITYPPFSLLPIRPHQMTNAKHENS